MLNQPKATRRSLKEILDRKEIKYSSKASLAELQALVDESKGAVKAKEGKAGAGEY